MKRNSISVLLCLAIFIGTLANSPVAFAGTNQEMQLTSQAKSLSSAEIVEYTKQSAQAQESGLLNVTGSDDSGDALAVIFCVFLLLGLIAAAASAPAACLLHRPRPS